MTRHLKLITMAFLRRIDTLLRSVYRPVLRTRFINSYPHYDGQKKTDFVAADDAARGGIHKTILAADYLAIGNDSHEMKFNYSWLRDHCSCPLCYNKISHQRQIDPKDIDPDISPNKVSITNEDTGATLQITWPDEHMSSYPLKWLSQIHSTITQPIKEETTRVFWDRQTLESSMPPDVTFEEYMESEEAVTRLLQNIYKFGVAFMSGVPKTTYLTHIIGERVSPLKRSVLGDASDYLSSAPEYHHPLVDESYGTDLLPFHSDYSHHHDPSGYSFMHFLKQSKDGGETILTDALRAARILRESYPEHYEALSTIPVAYHKIDKEGGAMMRCVSTVFDVRAPGEDPEIIRGTNAERAPLTVPHYDAKRWYAAWRQFRQITDDPKSVYTFKGTPGRPLFIDNMRLMHGRLGFTGARELHCYNWSYDRIYNQLRMRTGLDKAWMKMSLYE